MMEERDELIVILADLKNKTVYLSKDFDTSDYKTTIFNTMKLLKTTPSKLGEVIDFYRVFNYKIKVLTITEMKRYLNKLGCRIRWV
jgi:hypothetical protein